MGPLNFQMLAGNTRGATVIIAMAMSFVIMTFAFGIAATTQNAGEDIKNFKNSSQARISADSVQEDLLLLQKERESGFTAIGDDCESALASMGITPEVDSEGNPFLEVHCEVIGRSDELVYGTYRTVPFAIGTAGENCDIVNTAAYADDLDHACNWNKITVGNSLYSTAAIPLYIDAGDGMGG